MRASPTAAQSVSEEDRMRAHVYGLLGTLLARPPDRTVLGAISLVHGDETDMGKAIGALAKIASSLSTEQIAEEYQTLFIGIGRGEVLPYASYYLTGFLNEKPLARLRASMSDLGMERVPSVKEPEDHIAALMDMMAGLVLGRFGDGSLTTQQKFFEDHVGRWAPHLFADIEKAKNAVFYQPVGTIGRLFMEIEKAAFEMG